MTKQTLTDLIQSADLSAGAFNRAFGNVVELPVSPRLQAMANSTRTEAEARAQRNERKVHASYQRGYWHGYAHAVQETSLLDGAVVALSFLVGFGLALIALGAA